MSEASTSFASRQREHRMAMFATALIAIVASLFVYRPDRRVPFHILDFSEFLPLLRTGTPFIEKTWSVVRYYAAQGRLNVISYVALVAKWEVLGSAPDAWQFARAAEMWLIIALCYLAARRLGASRLGSCVGASIFLFSPCAVEAWTRLTMGEPLGTVLLLAACLVVMPARGPGQWSRWRLGAVFFLAALILLVKEMLAPVLVLPLLLAWLRNEPGTPIARSAALRRLIPGLALVGIVVLGLVLLVMRRAPHDAYASSFGAAWRPAIDVLPAALLILLPFEPFAAAPVALQLALLVGFVLGMVAGSRAAFADMTQGAVRAGPLIATVAGLAVLAGAIYLPWSEFSRFYGLPYLVGTALALALIATALQRQSTRWSMAIGAMATLWTIAGAVPAANVSARTQASRETFALLARRLSEPGHPDSFRVASPRVPRLAWSGLGATLGRYGRANGWDTPAGGDVDCRQLQETPAPDGVRLTVVFGGLCPSAMPSSWRITTGYRRAQFALPFLAPDSVYADAFDTRESSR